MYYADRLGLAPIREKLAEIAARSNDERLEPAPLITRLAAEGGSFASLAQAARSRT
jgi:3-hydroxyacyl-CoA dehydrogenase